MRQDANAQGIRLNSKSLGLGEDRKRNKNARGNQRIESTREEKNDENDENRMLTESDRL